MTPSEGFILDRTNQDLLRAQSGEQLRMPEEGMERTDSANVSTIPIRVMLVDYRNVTRAGLALLIEEQSDLVVVRQVAGVREARSSDAKPDIIVVDVDIPHVLPD